MLRYSQHRKSASLIGQEENNLLNIYAEKRLTQKVSFCFFWGGEEKFRRITTEN